MNTVLTHLEAKVNKGFSIFRDLVCCDYQYRYKPEDTPFLTDEEYDYLCRLEKLNHKETSAKYKALASGFLRKYYTPSHIVMPYSGLKSLSEGI